MAICVYIIQLLKLDGYMLTWIFCNGGKSKMENSLYSIDLLCSKRLYVCTYIWYLYMWKIYNK